MPNVIVNPVQTISVRVNQGLQTTVSGTSQFVGSSFSQANAALIMAQAAYDTANAAYGTANTKVSKSGDTMTGNLVVLANVNSSLFIGEIDGGTFT
jgi:hypothetical protein